MDTSRLVNIVFTDLTLQNLKIQEELDRNFNANSTDELNLKILKIKDDLNKLVINEHMIAKLKSLVQDPNNNTQTQEGEQDAKI